LELKRIVGELTDKENVKAANPKYKTKAYIYQNNCGNSTVAYELRRQGYDVEAKPGIGMDVKDLAGMFEGAVIKMATSLPMVSITEIERDLLAMGDGASGAIWGTWKVGYSHLFSFKVLCRKVIFGDGQKGVLSVNYLPKMELPSVGYIRLDNTKPNANVLKAVKNRGM
jgi:hypothetical protein